MKIVKRESPQQRDNIWRSQQLSLYVVLGQSLTTCHTVKFYRWIWSAKEYLYSLHGPEKIISTFEYCQERSDRRSRLHVFKPLSILVTEAAVAIVDPKRVMKHEHDWCCQCHGRPNPQEVCQAPYALPDELQYSILWSQSHGSHINIAYSHDEVPADVEWCGWFQFPIDGVLACQLQQLLEGWTWRDREIQRRLES